MSRKINCRRSEFTTFLWNDLVLKAISSNNLDQVTKLLNHQSLSGVQDKGYHFLLVACEKNLIEIVQYLLTIACNVNSKNSKIKPAKTPLHYAASFGNCEVVEMLLKMGAIIDPIDDLGNTPLFYAVFEKHIRIVQLLLCYGSQLQLQKCLHTAFKHPVLCVKMIELLLNYGISIDVSCMGESPLILLVAANGNEEVFNLLLARGADINSTGKYGETSLHISASEGHLPIVKHLVKEGVPVNACTLPSFDIYKYFKTLKQNCPSNVQNDNHARIKCTPLHFAVVKNKYEIVKFLLDQGADVNAQEKNGKTPLHIAVEEGHSSIVELILSYHPDIHNSGNKNVLVDAFVLIEKDSKIVQCLLEYGFSIGSDFINCRDLLVTLVDRGYLKILEDLIQHGADVNTVVKGDNYFSLLHIAVNNKNKEICELLLNNKALVNANDYKHGTPIFYAIKNDDVNITKLLLHHDARVKGSSRNFNYEDMFLLHRVVKNKNEELCELLLKYELNPDIEDTCKKTPILYAVENEDSNILNLLLNNSVNSNKNLIKALNVAIERGCLKIIELILHSDNNFNVNINDDFGLSPLLYTTLNIKDDLLRSSFYVCSDSYLIRGCVKYDPNNNDENRAAIVKLLIKRGADVNILAEVNANSLPNKNNSFTTLFAAAKNGLKVVVETLLEYNAEVNYLNFTDVSALHVAASEGHSGIVKTLLKYGADFKLKINNGMTPLHIACSRGCQNVVEVLIEFFCSNSNLNTKDGYLFLDFIDHKDNSGLSPLMIAAKRGFNSIVEILLNHGADPNSTDNTGKSALHFSAEEGNHYVLNKLLKFGCDINNVTKNGLNALDFAEMSADEFQNKYGSGGYTAYEDYDSSEGEFDYVIDHGINGSEVALSVLKSHIRKLYVANLFVSESNVAHTIKESEEDTEKNGIYYSLDDCQNELNAMKRHSISKSISYYDIVTGNINFLATCARNRTILQSFHLHDYEKKFPIYADIIHSHFRIGIKRNYLLEKCERCLQIIKSDWSKIPNPCVKKILINLNDNQLCAIINACKPWN